MKNFFHEVWVEIAPCIRYALKFTLILGLGAIVALVCSGLTLAWACELCSYIELIYTFSAFCLFAVKTASIVLTQSYHAINALPLPNAAEDRTNGDWFDVQLILSHFCMTIIILGCIALFDQFTAWLKFVIPDHQGELNLIRNLSTGVAVLVVATLAGTALIKLAVSFWRHLPKVVVNAVNGVKAIAAKVLKRTSAGLAAFVERLREMMEDFLRRLL